MWSKSVVWCHSLFPNKLFPRVFFFGSLLRSAVAVVEPEPGSRGHETPGMCWIQKCTADGPATCQATRDGIKKKAVRLGSCFLLSISSAVILWRFPSHHILLVVHHTRSIYIPTKPDKALCVLYPSEFEESQRLRKRPVLSEWRCRNNNINDFTLATPLATAEKTFFKLH